MIEEDVLVMEEIEDQILKNKIHLFITIFINMFFWYHIPIKKN